MKDPLISIVMPAYNAEKYIGQAIESIMHQSFSNWEIVIVDDSSTDNTTVIISEFQTIDNRIRSIRLDKNTGACYVPREKAVKLAKGDYVLLLDSDDYLDEQYIEMSLNRLSATGADTVLGVMNIMSESGNVCLNTVPARDFDLSVVLKGSEAFRLTIPWKIGLNGMVTKRECFLNALIQNENMFKGVYGDELCARRCLSNSTLVAFSSAKYFYRSNPTSLVHHFSPRIFDMFAAYSDVKKAVNELYPNDEQLKVNVEIFMFSGFKYVFNQYMRNIGEMSSSNRQIYKNRFKQWYNSIEWGIYPPPSIQSRLLETNGFWLFYNYRLLVRLLRGPN